MTPRKKKGIGFLVSGLVFLALGIILMVTTTTPAWVTTTLPIISGIANVIGLVLVIPSEVS